MATLEERKHAVKENLKALKALWDVGMLKPKVAAAAGKATKQWGTTPAAGYQSAATRLPYETGLIDDEGLMSFSEIDGQSNALANAFLERGLTPDDGVAILCRNHRHFVLAATALVKTGAATLYLNTGFAGPQMKEVLEREGAKAVIYDEEFAEMVESHVGHLDLYVAWHENDTKQTTLSELIAAAPQISPTPPEKPGKQIVLTSGTTGTPKGAKRPTPKGLVTTTGMFRIIPFRTRMTHFVGAPMFHALGNGGYQLSAQLSHKMIMQRRFDPETTIAAIAEHKVEAMTVVPVMLQRILALPDEVLDKYDCSSLKVVMCSGAALPGSLATKWMDRFGDNLYNMFASTEVGTATIASPADMRAAPGTAGRPVPGTLIRLYDDNRTQVTTPGVTGSIYVANDLHFEGYTSGDSKDMIDGYMSIGDVGHWDEGGRLHVGGRDDDMIVSGGENVYPREVEDLLADHPSVAEVAVIGVEDEDFGARLKAFVVVKSDQSLSEDEAKAYVKENLANYKVPKAVEFLDELPRNQTGKILKRELRNS